VAAPQDAKVVSSPRYLSMLDGRYERPEQWWHSWQEGQEEKPADTDQCHDITVYSRLGWRRCVLGNGILLDIKDRSIPSVWIGERSDYSYWHSASSRMMD